MFWTADGFGYVLVLITLGLKIKYDWFVSVRNKKKLLKWEKAKNNFFSFKADFAHFFDSTSSERVGECAVQHRGTVTALEMRDTLEPGVSDVCTCINTHCSTVLYSTHCSTVRLYGCLAVLLCDCRTVCK